MPTDSFESAKETEEHADNIRKEMFYHGEFIKMFPYCSGDTVNWYMPGGQSLPREIPVKEQFFIKQAMDYLTESIVMEQRDRTFEIIAKIKLFQRDMIGQILPGEGKTKAETFYNTIRSKKWPVFLSLTLSLLICVMMLTAVQIKRIRAISLLFVILLTSYVTLMLGLRWWIRGHLPVSNGHETMLFMAWVVLLLTIVLHKKFPIMVGFGPLVCSFCLLVAMLAGSNSQITPLMPVLQSPLLSVHVMTVMFRCYWESMRFFFFFRKKMQSWRRPPPFHSSYSTLPFFCLPLASFLEPSGRMFRGAIIGRGTPKNRGHSSLSWSMPFLCTKRLSKFFPSRSIIIYTW